MVSGRGIGLMINLLYGGTNPSFTSPLLQGLSTGHIGLDPDPADRVRWRSSSLLWLLLRRTALGLFLESVGGNRDGGRSGRHQRAADHLRRLSHLRASAPPRRASILTADTHTSDPVSIGLYIELDAILAVVIGGGSLAGGRIYLGMTILGALVIQALTTSILTSGLPPEYNLVVKAVVVAGRAAAAVGQLRAIWRCRFSRGGSDEREISAADWRRSPSSWRCSSSAACSTTTSSRPWCSATSSPTTPSSSSRRSARPSSSSPAASTCRSAR